jgi:hypothetical protein
VGIPPGGIEKKEARVGSEKGKNEGLTSAVHPLFTDPSHCSSSYPLTSSQCPHSGCSPSPSLPHTLRHFGGRGATQTRGRCTQGHTCYSSPRARPWGTLNASYGSSIIKNEKLLTFVSERPFETEGTSKEEGKSDRLEVTKWGCGEHESEVAHRGHALRADE